MPNRINFVTSNRSKFLALRDHIASYGFEVAQVELPLIEPQESSIEAVSRSKALQAFELIKQPVVVEDSGFFIDELAGFPGPYTKYALETIGVSGLLRLAEPLASRVCRFISVVTYVDMDGKLSAFVEKNGAGTLATTIDETDCQEMWSDLWRIFIPEGEIKPISAMSKADRMRLLQAWAANSVYTQLARWLAESLS